MLRHPLGSWSVVVGLPTPGHADRLIVCIGVAGDDLVVPIGFMGDVLVLIVIKGD